MTRIEPRATSILPCSRRRPPAFTLVVALLLSCGMASPAATVTVFAAASLTDVLKAMAAPYEASSGDSIRFNFAASSILARQIESGASADLVFSANLDVMDGLDRKGLIDRATRRDPLSNTLAVVVAKEGGPPLLAPEQLATPMVRRLALAQPKTVPAGIYAKTWLQEQNLWDQVQPKIIPTMSVRSAMSAVELGNADAAIVYRTDAASSDKVRVAIAVPREHGPAIRYSVALLKEPREPEAARRFLDHLGTGEAGRIFERFGFILLK